MKAVFLMTLLLIVSCSSSENRNKRAKISESFNKYMNKVQQCKVRPKRIGTGPKPLKLERLSQKELAKRDFTFLDTSIREALLELSTTAEIPIVFDETVTGIVTLNVVKRNFVEILEMITASGPFDFKKENGYYFIGLVEKDSANWTRLAYSHHYQTKYQFPSKIIKSLNPAFLPYLSANDNKGNLTITASRKVLKNIYKQIVQLDQRSEQIQLEITISEVSIKGRQILGGVLTGQMPNGSVGEVNKLFGTMFGSVVKSLRALESNGELEVKANPPNLDKQGEMANYSSLVKDYDYVKSYHGRKELVETGIKLKIIPTISHNEYINLVIPELKLGDLGNTGSSRVVEHSLSTSIKVKQGEAILIGGMLHNKKTLEITKIPKVGDIPVAGWFFKERQKSDELVEVVFLIRPVVKCQDV